MASATQIAGTDKGQLAEAFGKRKRITDDTPGSGHSAAEEVVERKYGLNLNILECPICSEPFSPLVYQCPNGHTACSACCTKLVNKRCLTCTLPIGRIRCIVIEKVLESLLVSCKYVGHGCKTMLKQANLKKHEICCLYEPYCCPIPECIYEGTKTTLPLHLTEEHEVQRVALNSISGVDFKMESSKSLMMVKGD